MVFSIKCVHHLGLGDKTVSIFIDCIPSSIMTQMFDIDTCYE